MNNFLIGLALWNLWAFVVTAYDKMIAGSKVRRVRERTLLLLAACLGAVGVYAAMRIFHHKTLHRKFKYGVPVLLVLNIVWVYFVLRWLR